MIPSIPSLLDIYTIDAHSIYFQFCNLIALPSLLVQCYILMQYLFFIYSSQLLVLFLVSFNVYATPSFKDSYFDKFDKFILFLNTLTLYYLFNILIFHGILLYSISFLYFCIYNFRTKSQFHVKWICRNKFIIIIINNNNNNNNNFIILITSISR